MVDVCCLLHRYQLHVSALMAIFRLNELAENIGSYICMRLIYGVGFIFIRRMPNIIAYVFCQFIQPELAINAETCSSYLCNKQHTSTTR